MNRIHLFVGMLFEMIKMEKIELFFVNLSQIIFDFLFLNRVPIIFCWDNEDARILACETRRLVSSNEKRPPTSMGTMRNIEKKLSPSHQNATSEHTVESQVFILFPTNDIRNTIKSMEVLDLQFGEQLIDMYTPYVVMIHFEY